MYWERAECFRRWYCKGFLVQSNNTKSNGLPGHFMTVLNSQPPRHPSCLHLRQAMPQASPSVSAGLHRYAPVPRQIRISWHCCQPHLEWRPLVFTSEIHRLCMIAANTFTTPTKIQTHLNLKKYIPYIKYACIEAYWMFMSRTYSGKQKPIYSIQQEPQRPFMSMSM